MSNVNKTVIKEKPMSQRLREKRTAQEAEGSMVKTAPPEPGEDVIQTPGAIQTHPLEEAAPHMDEVMQKMEQTRQVLAGQYNAIKHLKATGDAGQFLDKSLATNPEAWAKKSKEFTSLMNKLLTLLPTV